MWCTIEALGLEKASLAVVKAQLQAADQARNRILDLCRTAAWRETGGGADSWRRAAPSAWKTAAFIRHLIEPSCSVLPFLQHWRWPRSLSGALSQPAFGCITLDG